MLVQSNAVHIEWWCLGKVLNWLFCVCKVLSWRSCVASPCQCERITDGFHTTTGSMRWRWPTACTSFFRKPLESSLNWRSVHPLNSPPPTFPHKKKFLHTISCCLPLFLCFYIHAEERSAYSLLVSWLGPPRLQQQLPAEVWPPAGGAVLHVHHGTASLLPDGVYPAGRALTHCIYTHLASFLVSCVPFLTSSPLY